MKLCRSEIREETMAEVGKSPERVISLTLTSRYAGSWGTWEGVRELIQNWHDGIYDAMKYHCVSLNTEHKINFKKIKDDKSSIIFQACLSDKEIVLGKLIYDKFSHRLLLINSSTELHKKILLLGYSGKATNKEVIGQFGEGLKVGALALVRKGHLVSMETCNDCWMFDLLHNEDFGEKVLSVVVTDRVQNSELDSSEEFLKLTDGLKSTDTITTVSGLTSEDWRKFLPRFLFLTPAENCMKTELGSLLLDEHLSGQLYVKGLWVSDLSGEDLSAGVDLSSLQLDRDRNAVPKPSEIDHLLSCIWIKAVEANPSLCVQYYHLLKHDKYRDVRHAVSYSTLSVSLQIAEQFSSEYGKGAFPVLNSSTVEEINSVRDELKKQVVLCNQTILDILIKSGVYNSLSSELEDARAYQRTNIPFFSLEAEEQNVLKTVIDLTKMAEIDITLSCLDVVETSSREVCSSTDTGDIRVPRWYLNTKDVHKRVMYCTAENTWQKCYCREVMLFDAILKTWHGKNTSEDPVLRFLHHFMNQKSVDFKRDYETDTNKTPEKDLLLESSENMEVFVARERKYIEKIEKLEELLKNEKECHSNTLKDVKCKLDTAEKELMKSELSFVNGEGAIRKQYEEQLQKYRADTERDASVLKGWIEQKNLEIIDLKRVVEHNDRIIQDLKLQNENLADAAEKKTGVLLEELSHYISQNRNRTKNLSHLFAEQVKNSEDKGKWRLLQDLCDVIIQDLQKEKIVCAICLQRRKSCMAQPCGHYCMCEDCASTLLSTRQMCPICKRSMNSYQQVYD